MFRMSSSSVSIFSTGVSSKRSHQAGLVDVAAAERFEYDAEALRGMIGSDLDWAGQDPHALDDALAGLQGKVASVRFVGGKAV